MQRKKIISGIVVITLLLTSAFSVGAEKAIETTKADESLQSQISPMYTHIAAIGAYLKISNGTAICTGALIINNNYSSVMTMTLQRSVNGINWTSVTSPWSQAYYSSGDFTFEKRHSPLSSGYIYRVQVTVNVGNGLEIVTAYSPQVYY